MYIQHDILSKFTCLKVLNLFLEAAKLLRVKHKDESEKDSLAAKWKAVSLAPTVDGNQNSGEKTTERMYKSLVSNGINWINYLSLNWCRISSNNSTIGIITPLTHI